MNKITLYRPVGQKELELIVQSGWIKFPPRLPEQPIFYPVLNYEYANDINQQWNENGVVMEFDIDGDYICNFEIHNVGAKYHNEYWIPTDELENFNKHIIGKIRKL